MATKSYQLVLNKGAFADVKCPASILGHAKALDFKALFEDAKTLKGEQQQQVVSLAQSIAGLKAAINSRIVEDMLGIHITLEYHVTDGGTHSLRLKAVGAGCTCYKAVNTTASQDWRKVVEPFAAAIAKKREAAAAKPARTRKPSKRVQALEEQNAELQKQNDVLLARLASLEKLVAA